MDEFRECPLCASENVEFCPKNDRFELPDSTAGFIWCHGCNFTSDIYANKSVAAEKWNRRVPDVVRCGECKRFGRNTTVNTEYGGCYPHGNVYSVRTVHQDFYCADGERESEGKSDGT